LQKTTQGFKPQQLFDRGFAEKSKKVVENESNEQGLSMGNCINVNYVEKLLRNFDIWI
jgi:hypothetical protein